MSKPILVFLHGVGTGDPAGKWKERLSETLVHVGYPGLDEVRVIAPRYAHALKGSDEKETLPAVVGKQPAGEAARKNRREFERRVGAIEFRLGSQDPGDGYIGGDALVDLAVSMPFFAQAKNYLTAERIRAQVLNRILSKLPESGPIVLVGHSLGSVIAADLVRRLPAGIEVVGMVTLGSPLASESFGVDNLRGTLREPPTNLAWWVSFWDRRDPVAARRGVSSAFPWMIDFQVKTPALNPATAHQAVEYLAHDIVAEAIGFALFGSRSKELAQVERGIDVPVDTAEDFALLALRYAHLIRQRLTGEQQERYAGALRNVQANIVAVLKEQRAATGRPLPGAVTELAFDLSDPSASAPEPRPARHLTKEEAVVPLTVLMVENVILPYEIHIAADKKLSAMSDLTAEMGLGGVFGKEVFAAAKIAQNALGANPAVNWFKWGALGAGAAALVVATGGLALAAGPGLAGAAAITSALAAFGPGGMIGGLLTAGTLVTAGGGGIAFGLASQDTPAETLEAVVSRQLTAEILRKKHGLEPDPAVRRNLVETEMELRRQHERLDEFSDETASSVKELKRKVAAVERALEYLNSSGLTPDGDADATSSSKDEPRAPWYKWAGRAASTPWSTKAGQGSVDALFDRFTNVVSEFENQASKVRTTMNTHLDDHGRLVSVDRIVAIDDDEVFVFGANGQGRHGSGSARAAYDHFGAGWGVADGPTGQSYAIDTMSGESVMAAAIERFLGYAAAHPASVFLVTAIGTGIAGYTHAQVAKYFAVAGPNVALPEEFWGALRAAASTDSEK